MKKLFVALMAVLVLASCGETKTTPKTEADVMVMTAAVMESAAVKLESATTADEVIDVMASVVTEMNELKNVAGDLLTSLDGMDQEVLLEKYPEEMKSVEAAGMKYTEVLMTKMEIIQNMTPEQQERLVEIFNGLEM